MSYPVPIYLPWLRCGASRSAPGPAAPATTAPPAPRAPPPRAGAGPRAQRAAPGGAGRSPRRPAPPGASSLPRRSRKPFLLAGVPGAKQGRGDAAAGPVGVQACGRRGAGALVRIDGHTARRTSAAHIPLHAAQPGDRYPAKSLQVKRVASSFRMPQKAAFDRIRTRSKAAFVGRQVNYVKRRGYQLRLCAGDGGGLCKRQAPYGVAFTTSMSGAKARQVSFHVGFTLIR